MKVQVTTGQEMSRGAGRTGHKVRLPQERRDSEEDRRSSYDAAGAHRCQVVRAPPEVSWGQRQWSRGNMSREAGNAFD